jgi:hypothetical protein
VFSLQLVRGQLYNYPQGKTGRVLFQKQTGFKPFFDYFRFETNPDFKEFLG